MMLLSRCCCCFNLKYGYFAYGIISMAARLMTCFGLYRASQISFGPYTSTSGNTYVHIFLSQAVSFYSGWVITGVISLFFTLKGIVQKRSILIYPYIVVLSVELFSFITLGIILSMVVTPFYLIVLPLGSGIIGYELWCLISLYKHIKSNEGKQYMGDAKLLRGV